MRSEEIREASKKMIELAATAPTLEGKQAGLHAGVMCMLAEIAAQLSERNERERGQVADRQRTPSPTEAPPEDFPVPAKKLNIWCLCRHDILAKDCKECSQPQAGDVIAQVASIIRTKFHENPATSYNEIATEVSQVIVRDRDAQWKAAICKLWAHWTKNEAWSEDDFVEAVVRNLGLEVQG